MAHPFRFYEIISKKSEISSSGIRQLSFACEDNPEVFCFIWINQSRQLKHIQVLFGESVLEWESDLGIRCGQTNRVQDPEVKIGIHKGSRSLHLNEDPKLLSQSMEKIKRCVFPEEWNVEVHSIFSKTN